MLGSAGCVPAWAVVTLAGTKLLISSRNLAAGVQRGLAKSLGTPAIRYRQE
jgi:hypothetical protein